MNAARSLLSVMPRETVARLLRNSRGESSARGGTDTLRKRASAAFEGDLVALLNALKREELGICAGEWKIEDEGAIGRLRTRLWEHGAAREAGGAQELGTPWQPRPDELRGKLVYVGPVRGELPPAAAYPRPIPPPVPAVPAYDGDPDTVEELLERASALVGLPLGQRGRDKGAYGTKIASLLGLVESGFAEPDWRGFVEVKTLPVIHDRDGRWRVKEDPAISMENVRPMSKLMRVLWIARVADQEDSPILSWYYQEWDATVAQMACRHLHQRPKGPKGTDKRGWYLRKHFFTESGLLRSLNG